MSGGSIQRYFSQSIVLYVCLVLHFYWHSREKMMIHQYFQHFGPDSNIAMIRFCTDFHVPQRVKPLAPHDQLVSIVSVMRHHWVSEQPQECFKVKLTWRPNHVVTTSGDAQRPTRTFGSILTPTKWHVWPSEFNKFGSITFWEVSKSSSPFRSQLKPLVCTLLSAPIYGSYVEEFGNFTWGGKLFFGLICILIVYPCCSLTELME